jgi:hypothetical protein
MPSQREFAAVAALVCAVGAGSTALFAWPEGVAFVNLRSRLLVVAGWSVCIIGFTAGLGLAIIASFRSSAAINIFLYAGLALAFLGFMAARLPRMVAQVAQSRADLAALKSVSSASPKFDGLNEGFAASLSVVRDGRVFLQIAAPWAVFLAGAAYLLLAFDRNVGRGSPAAWLILLGVLLLLVVAIYLIIPTVAVAWFRWVIGGKLPSRFLALPDRTVLSFAWRIWISLTFLGGVDRLVTPKLTAFLTTALPQFAATVGDLTGWAIDILIVMLVSSIALHLPAVAVGDTTFGRTVAAVEGRKMWPGLPVGLALSLGAFPLLAWVCVRAYAGMSPAAPPAHSAAMIISPSDAVGLAGWLMVLFAALASGATLLSRAYLAAKTRIGLALG